MAKCLACGSEHHSSHSYPGSKNPLGFSLIQLCQDCGHGQVITGMGQAELDSFYQDGAYWGETAANHSTLAHNDYQAELRVRDALRAIKGRTLKTLDVGAGMGDIGHHLLRLAPTSEYHFIEPDPAARRKIQDRLKKFSIVDASKQSANDYDLIFLNHVLEHTLLPAQFLHEFAEKLKPEGIIYVEIPNRDDRFKDNVFPHTMFFTRQSVERMVSHSLLEILDLKTFGRYPRPATSTKDRVLAGLFYRSSRFPALRQVSKFLDDALFNYGHQSADGIWHGVLLKKKGARS